MNDQDTLRLLRECDAGAKMGVASIDGVIEDVKNQELHDLLQNSKQRHEQLGDRTAQLLSQWHEEGKEPSLMAKSMSSMKISMKMMGSYCPVMNVVKYPSCAASAPCPVRNATKYFTTQPPITQ